MYLVPILLFEKEHYYYLSSRLTNCWTFCSQTNQKLQGHTDASAPGWYLTFSCWVAWDAVGFYLWGHKQRQLLREEHIEHVDRQLISALTSSHCAQKFSKLKSVCSFVSLTAQTHNGAIGTNMSNGHRPVSEPFCSTSVHVKSETTAQAFWVFFLIIILDESVSSVFSDKKNKKPAISHLNCSSFQSVLHNCGSLETTFLSPCETALNRYCLTKAVNNGIETLHRSQSFLHKCRQCLSHSICEFQRGNCNEMVENIGRDAEMTDGKMTTIVKAKKSTEWAN